MSARSAARLAWSLCALSVVSAAIGQALLFQSRHTPANSGTDHGGSGLFTLDELAFAVVGALIASRRHSNPVGWLLLCSGVTSSLGINGLGYGYAYDSLEGPVGPLPGAIWFAWYSAALENIGLLATIAAFVVFPTGRLPSPRWWPVVWLVFALGAVVNLAVSLRPGPLANFAAIDNPLGLSGAAGGLAVALSELYVRGVLPMLFLVAAAVLLVRLFTASGVERQQLKWVAYAVTFFPVFFVTMLVIVWAARSSDPFLVGLSEWLGAWSFALAVAGLPVSVGIAVLRYRLYEIDVIIRRTLVYGALTAGLGVIYWGSIVVLQQVSSPLTQGSDLAVVGSTLAVAALFQPLRQRIQLIVDRRFYRQRYDAARTLEAFSARLRDELDLDSLGAELLTVVGKTMQPQRVSLWLRPLADRIR